MENIYELSLEKHKEAQGKLNVCSSVPLESRDDMRVYYTPGVAQPCLEIQKDPEKAYDYTIKGHTVAVITDGSAVLGLGNIGALAGLPVMEGKCGLFKKFAGVDAFPICVDSKDPDEFIRIVESISGQFGGINLEDIAAPNCFYIENELKKRLKIPVFHDDQHGTAIVVLAGLINSLKLTGKSPSENKVVISGTGAAGSAIARLLVMYGFSNVNMIDSKGLIYEGREDLDQNKIELSKITNPKKKSGSLSDALVGADIFIGVSKPKLVTAEMISSMAEKPIIFALANPEPEILPDEAKKAGAFIVASGRSDFPNQVNNVLAFPGIFKGALKYRIPQITDEMKLNAAKSLASMVKEVSPENIIPDPFTPGVADTIADSIKIRDL
ncbi:MAG: NADP-dependent malic enzyme [Candidatus Gracilibacteria bacterium]|jgi:malate dehydrogenase (oxaloacetate-decarboxylating)|nr:NADP-dependent malic enzyme [Candidatus Gracilibacteria bacterium]